MVDPAFDPGIGPDAVVRALAVQNDGRTVIGGDFVSVNTVPRPHIARLNAEANKAVHTNEVKAILATEASEAVGTTPEEFDAIMKREVARWMQVVKAAGIKGE